MLKGICTKNKMFRNSFYFEGRIRRMEYGLSTIIYCIWIFFSSSVAISMNADNYEGIYLTCLLPGSYFYIVQGTKGGKAMNKILNSKQLNNL